MTLRAVLVILLAVGAAASISAWEPPVEPPRLLQSSLTALYAPSFGLLSKSAYPLHDNFSVDGNYVNLFPKGQNLNFYFGALHSIKDMPIFPAASTETEGFNRQVHLCLLRLFPVQRRRRLPPEPQRRLHDEFR